MTQLVHTQVVHGLATFTLDSPHNRNALSAQLVAELGAALDQAAADPDVRAVLLRSSGRVFCSGADLSEAAEGDMRRGAEELVGLLRRILALPVPVVAEIAGPVRAGGIGIVAACDIAVAVESATFAFTEVKLALAPAVISLTVLPRLTSRAAARTFLTAEQFDGRAAAVMGLITEAVSPDALHGVVAQTCDALVSSPVQGLRETKRLLNRDLLARLDDRGAELAALSAELFGSEPARQAMRAFLSRS
jgi:enoyl-CoA hydratase/methylglutaconyl-CoA hydratase